MPVRSLNYTGRKRITKEEVAISLREEPDGRIIFDADIRLRKGRNFPDDARIYVEAYRGSSATWMRFPFGTVGALVSPDTRLTDFDSADGILFRVRVTSVGAKQGLLLGEAEKIRPNELGELEPARRSILRVRSDRNLEQQVYRVDFEDGPVLLVNSSLGDWRDVVLDRVFLALVLPCVLEAILVRILSVDKYTDEVEEENTDWRSEWLVFAKSLPGVGELPNVEDKEVVNEWIESVVRTFCRKQRMLERYGEYWNRGDS